MGEETRRGGSAELNQHRLLSITIRPRPWSPWEYLFRRVDGGAENGSRVEHETVGDHNVFVLRCHRLRWGYATNKTTRSTRGERVAGEQSEEQGRGQKKQKTSTAVPLPTEWRPGRGPVQRGGAGTAPAAHPRPPPPRISASGGGKNGEKRRRKSQRAEWYVAGGALICNNKKGKGGAEEKHDRQRQSTDLGNGNVGREVHHKPGVGLEPRHRNPLQRINLKQEASDRRITDVVNVDKSPWHAVAYTHRTRRHANEPEASKQSNRLLRSK